MSTPPLALIAEIACDLEVGYRVFVHKSTGALRTYIDPEKSDCPEQEFADEFKFFLEEEASQYVEVEHWSTADAFRIMEAFAEQLTDAPGLQKQLFYALGNRKPLSGFKWKIDNNGPHRQQWFDFKSAQEQELVKKQLEFLLGTEE